MRARNGQTTDAARGQGQPRSTRQRAELVFAGVLGAALTTAAAAISTRSLDGDAAGLIALARAAMVGLPVAVGIYAWHRGPDERFGRLLVGMGYAWFLTTLSESDDEVLYSIGRISGWVVEVGIVWLILSFPTGRLTSRVDRGLVLASAVLVGALYLPSALLTEGFPVPSTFTSCTEACPDNAFIVLGSEPGWIDSLLLPVRGALTILLFIGVTVRLVWRIRSTSWLMRRTLSPVLFVAGARLAIMAAALGARGANPDSPAAEALSWAAALAVPGLAVGCFVGLLQGRLYVADALEELGLRVRSNLTRDQVRDALGDALHDPSLELAFWVNGGRDRWVDASGRDLEPPALGSGRCLAEIREGDRLVAGLVYDAALDEQRAFVEAVAAYALIALENRRLAVKVEASLREVRESRARIVASADAERRRIERDLHDGAQQRLVALGIRLALAEEVVAEDPDAGRRRLHELGEEVAATLEEIRGLAHGVYPALLSDRGLAEALDAAAMRLPIPATVDRDGVGRYPHEVESVVYFCCMEAMQNALKHAHDAHRLRIVLAEDDGLRFEVKDDGEGFNGDTRMGAGLTNMRDRVAAVGGELDIHSEPGEGTVVSGRIPLAAA